MNMNLKQLSYVDILCTFVKDIVLSDSLIYALRHRPNCYDITLWSVHMAPRSISRKLLGL